MTTPDFRALCAELLEAWQLGDDIAGPMNRARAALKAEPEGGAPRPCGDWFTVAMIAQDMRSRGLAEQVAGEELLKLANGKHGLGNLGRPATSPASEPEGKRPSDQELYDLAAEFDGDPVPAMRQALELWGNPLQGASAADLLPVEPPNIPTTMAMQYRSAWREGVEDGWSEARAFLARWRPPSAAAPAPGENLAIPPSPEAPGEALAARPLLEKVARLHNSVGITVAEVRQLAGQAAAWLRSNPPGQPVKIEPRGCPTPGACSCVEPTPPAPEPGEVGKVVGWLNQVAQYLVDNGVTGAPHVQGAAILLERQDAELAALRVAPGPTFQDAIKLAQGCHDYSGGHSGAEGEAWHGAIGTVVDVLKRAAIKRWDSQLKAVYGVGVEAQAGELAVSEPVSERLRIVRAGIRAGYNLGHHHTVEGGWGDPDEVADDIAQETLDDIGLPPAPQCLMARMADELDRLQTLPAFPPVTSHPLAAEARALLQGTPAIPQPAPQAGEVEA